MVALIRTGFIAFALVLFSACQAELSTHGSASTGRTGDGTTTSDPRVPSTEACNGADEDLDGLVDEGCSCTAGATQTCFPYDPDKRGVGQCLEGTQICAEGLEFGVWGECFGSVAPDGAEVPGNCVDEDCDGFMPGCDEPCDEFEICDNGVDDNCDGAVDCDDAACDCPGDDGFDECATNPDACDCETRCVAGTERFCDEPRFCFWGKQQCAPDGRWGACTETTDIPAACRGGGLGIPFLPDGSIYDPACCVLAGECCQNFGFDPTLGIDDDVGDCSALTETICEPRR